jgi:hypothetical protein
MNGKLLGTASFLVTKATDYDGILATGVHT